MIKRMLALFLTVCFMITVIMPVYADELDETRQQLKEVGRDIEETKQNINEASQQANSIMGQLQTLDQNINSTQQEINTMEQHLSTLQDNIDKTEKEILKQEEELDEQVDYMSDRLVFMYEEGMDVSYLEVLLSSANIKEFLTRYDLLCCIVDQDKEMIESIQREKRDLDIKKSDLEVQRMDLVSAKKSQELKINELSVQRSQRKDMLNSVQSQKAAFEQALEELERNSRELEQLILRSQSGTALGTGVYTWPAPGYHTITSPYGMRFHPILQTRKMHTGVDIAAPSGADIVAADSGVVIYEGWNGGYGQVIIIDHGVGMSTLYAHQSRFVVSYGETVTKGQVIGKVGTTGWSTGPHLHFEVRINGSYTDPMPYIN